ncbi:MAG TPA: response regulator [Terracidiphilus sp.]|nr:response regulator [Terracidiphilus sp.]
MTTESTQPQPELGPAPDNGQVQSQGHRRRRRRRKNKSSQQGAPQNQQGQQAPLQPQMQAPQPAHAKPVHQGQGRKKKKFFQKNGGPPQSPGNGMGGPHQGKRKNKQKGPREFVGPMDHSYRAANGNVADGPPSTIQLGSSNHSAHYADAYAHQPAAPVRENAPTRIFCFIEDLFFLAKIQETARKLGVKVEFVKGDKDVVTRILEAPEGERPTLLVFDLNNLNAKPMTLIPKFKAKFKKSVSVIGFLSHVQGDLKMKGVEAGCDVVMPRSAFSQSLPNLLRRYGVEEEEEYAQQPV